MRARTKVLTKLFNYLRVYVKRRQSPN